MKWQVTLVVAQVVTLLACASAANSGSAIPPPPVLDKPFTLKVGASAPIDGENIRIGFESVVADSRCPRGVQCIRAGEAILKLWLSQGRQREVREVKSFPPSAAQVEIDRYRLTIVSVEPEPSIDRELRDSDYVATLTVTRLR